MQNFIDNQLVTNVPVKILPEFLGLSIAVSDLCPPKKWEYSNRWDSADFT